MLVDAATVVVELADRNLAKGMGRKEAYHKAAIAMAWPMTASTLAIIVVFLPLLFWPGIVGEFMKYLPITLILTLAGSLVMAFTVIPVVGAYIGGPNPAPAAWENSVTRWYLKLLGTAIARPMRSLVIGSGVFFGGAVIYFALGYGTQFFPSIDAERADIVVRAKGDFSVEEKDRIVAQVEERIIGTPGVKTVYARSGNLGSRRGGGAQDVVGRIFIEFEKWEVRRTKSDVIMADILKRVGPINGVIVQAEGERQGPAQGKPIRIGVLADNFATAAPVARVLTEKLKAMPGTRNVTNSLPDPGIEWNMVVDRDEAARAGTSLGVVGATLQLGTTGMIVGNYRPDDQEEEIDIVARFKPDERNTNTLDDLRVPTPNGAIPIANLAKREAQPKVTMIERLDQKTVVYVEGDTAKGVLANTILAQVKAGLATTELPKGVSIRLLGDEKDQKETGRFLAMAFVIALFAMVLVFVTQFNSISQAMIVMSAVAFSTAGVFIGHLILGQPFGIVMSGLGVIALAGIIVNNNVVLIDTYNELRAEGLAWREALLKTCETRWRPVFLTAATTVVGLIPMGMRLNIDLLNRSVVYDAPSTQWWDQLSNAIMFGCTFATVLTLVLTPCMLAWVELRKERKILGLQAANTPAPQGKTLPKVQVTVTRPGKNKR
jgi:multidrug efflux pump